MSYVPAIPFTGYAGWTFLNRTMASQTATMNATSQNKRDEDYFRANIGKIDTAEQLVNDRRLLKVALGAFGLDNDINNKFFVVDTNISIFVSFDSSSYFLHEDRP